MSKEFLKACGLLPVAGISFPAYAADYLTAEQAQKALFTEADEFQAAKVKLTDDQIKQIKELAGTRQRNESPLVWRASKKGKRLGWFFIDEVVGKHEFITYGVGVSAENTVLGIEILSYRETHGGEIRDSSWRKRFAGKKLSDPFKLDVDVPNITGATLSCRNVLDGVKRVLVLRQILGDV